jgi:hypothetical protein
MGQFFERVGGAVFVNVADGDDVLAAHAVDVFHAFSARPDDANI